MKSYDPDEFVMWIASLINRAITEENVDDFAVNVAQANKFAKAYQYFTNLAKENGGRIDGVMLQPQFRVAGFTIQLPYLDLVAESVKEFASQLQEADAVTFSPTNDVVDISINIPNVFYPKS